MKFCRHCGSEMLDEAVVCTKCGCPVKDKLNRSSLIGTKILSFLMNYIDICLNFALFLIYSFVRKLTGNTVDGWTFIVTSLWLVGGVQLLSLGIIGEYVGKIYNEVKRCGCREAWWNFDIDYNGDAIF